MLELIAGYMFIFAARICDVSLGTMRTLMVVKGKKIYAALFGFFEVILYIIVLDIVFSNLDNRLNLLFYAAGFATGNILGSFIEEKLAVGTQTVQVITMKAPLILTEKLRQKGYGVTVIEGLGREGIHYILQIILPRRRIHQLRREVDQWDKEAFWTIFDARYTKGGIFTTRKGK